MSNSSGKWFINRTSEVGSYVWEGKRDEWPSPDVMSNFISVDLSPEDLTSFTFQIVKNAPPNAIASLLQHLACFYCRNEDNLIDVSSLVIFFLN